MRKPEHEDYELSLLTHKDKTFYELGNECHVYHPTDFEGLMKSLLDVFESEYGSRRTYSLKVNKEANQLLGENNVNLLERMISLQNRIATARIALF